jgi:hypothetical protein
MARYQKKPVVIYAEQYDGTNNPFGIIEYHKCDYRMCPLCGGDNQSHAYIKTLEGGHIATVGDFIIKGIQGEFYPCKPDIFEQTYTPVE